MERTKERYGYHLLAYTTGMSIISLKALSLNTPPTEMGLRDADGDNVDDRLLFSMPEASGMDMAMSEDGNIAYIADYSHDVMKVVSLGAKLGRYKIPIVLEDKPQGSELVTGIDKESINTNNFKVQVELCDDNSGALSCEQPVTIGGYEIQEKAASDGTMKTYIWLMEDANNQSYFMFDDTEAMDGNRKYRVTFESKCDMIRDRVLNKWDMDHTTSQVMETRGIWTFGISGYGSVVNFLEEYLEVLDNNQETCK